MNEFGGEQSQRHRKGAGKRLMPLLHSGGHNTHLKTHRKHSIKQGKNHV